MDYPMPFAILRTLAPIRQRGILAVRARMVRRKLQTLTKEQREQVQNATVHDEFNYSHFQKVLRAKGVSLAA